MTEGYEKSSEAPRSTKLLANPLFQELVFISTLVTCSQKPTAHLHARNALILIQSVEKA